MSLFILSLKAGSVFFISFIKYHSVKLQLSREHIRRKPWTTLAQHWSWSWCHSGQFSQVRLCNGTSWEAKQNRRCSNRDKIQLPASCPSSPPHTRGSLLLTARLACRCHRTFAITFGIFGGAQFRSTIHALQDDTLFGNYWKKCWNWICSRVEKEKKKRKCAMAMNQDARILLEEFLFVSYYESSNHVKESNISTTNQYLTDYRNLAARFITWGVVECVVTDALDRPLVTQPSIAATSSLCRGRRVWKRGK